MRNIITFLLYICLPISCIAQSKDDIGKITFSVLAPTKVGEGLTESQTLNLNAKCIQIATAGEQMSEGNNTPFIIIPRLVINDTKVADGGMQSITIVSAELSMFIQLEDSHTTFSTFSKTISGSGSSKEAAISNAISGIQTNDVAFHQFFETARKKIIAYYEGHCSSIMQEAEVMVKKQDYESALSLLMTIPEAVKGCHDKAQARSLAVYKAYEAKMCEQQIQDARIYLAGNNYEEALETLKEVDPACKCSKEAKDLIAETAKKVTAEQKREWDLLLKVYEDNINLEKYYVDAAKEVAAAALSKRKHHR